MERPFFQAFAFHYSATVTKYHFLAIRVDLDAVTVFEFPFENLNRQGILNQSLYSSFQGPRTVDGVITLVSKQCFRPIGNLKRHFSARQVLAQALELNLDNRLDFFASQAVENDDLIDAVQEFRLEAVAKRRHYLPLHFLAVCASQILDILAAQVRGHDNNCVLEIDGSALTIGHATVFEDLQQSVKDFRVGLFDLIEQHH